LPVIQPEQSQSLRRMRGPAATDSALEWKTPEQSSYSQRKTFAESTVQKRNDTVIAATSPMWVNHLSPFQIPLSRFTA
jgi:hypothetical protein